MARPNGRGGWELTDADIAEMQGLGMVEKPLVEHDEFFLNGVRYYTQAQLDAEIRRVRDDERAKREAEGPWFKSVVHECCEKAQDYRRGVEDAAQAVVPMEAVVLRIAATLLRHPSEDERHDALQRHWSFELKSALDEYRAAIRALVREKP